MLSRWSVDHPVAAAMLVLSLVALGIISIIRLNTELYPRLDFPGIAIMAVYPGASPSNVEEQVTKPIEEAVSGIPGVKQITSESSENLSIIGVTLEYGADIQKTLDKARNELDKIKSALPKEVENPTVSSFSLSAFPVLSFSLYGDIPLSEISSYANDKLKNEIKQIEGVASVNISGVTEKQVVIDLDPSKLKKYEITADQIAGAIALYDTNMPLGKVESADKSFNIRLSGGLANIDFIKNIIVRPYLEYEEMPSQQEIASNLRRSIQRQVSNQLAAAQRAQREQMKSGQQPQATTPQMRFTAPRITTKKKSLPEVKLHQIAAIKEHEEITDKIFKINGKPAVGIDIRKDEESNTVQVVDDIKEKLKKQIESFPKGLEYAIFLDQSENVRSSVGGITRSAAYAAILATIVLLIFLRSIRSTFIIALSIPASVIATFMIIYFAGLTLNMVTIGALALGIGMVVDNSIVVLENIFRHMESGLTPKEAARIGGHEVTGAITASTFTSIAVFLPILFIGGMAKEWLGPLAVVVMSILAFSLLISLTLIPMLASKLYKLGYGTKKVKRKVLGLDELYKPVISLSLKYRYIVIFLIILSFAATVFAARTIGAVMMPGVTTQEIVFMNVELPPEASRTASLAVAEKIEKSLKGMKGIRDTSTIVGTQSDMLTEQTATPVTINLWLEDASEREHSLSEMVEEARSRTSSIKGARNIVVRGGAAGLMGGNSAPIQLNISGPSLEKLEQITDDIKKIISKIPGIDSVSSTVDETKPEYLVNVDHNKTMKDSVSLMSVANLIRIAMHGQEVAKIKNENGLENKLVMKMSKAAADLNLLKTIPIQTPDDYKTMGDYISIDEGKTLKTIYRENRNRTMNIAVDIDKNKVTISEKTNEIKDILKDLKLPDGYKYTLGGEAEEMSEIFSDMGQAMILAVILVYMLMAAQFGSLKNPFIIMFTIPLAAIGVVSGLKIASTPFSMIVFLGLITLAGIVVNNGIILIDFVNTLRERGMKVNEALISAGMLRVRPILITSATTVLAMAPVAINIGGKQMMAPMAIAIMGGLTFSTVLSLIFVPAIFSVFNKDKPLEHSDD